MRGLPREAVRAVGTNSLRVAKNAPEFLHQAEAALGFPIEVIAGREEARLIYLGVAHGLPQADGKRLVMDIGGGSTEFIIGERACSRMQLESLYMGCVSYSLRFFPDGKITKAESQAGRTGRAQRSADHRAEFSHGHWDVALGSSGTARVLCDVLEQNGYSDGGITRLGLEELREQLLKVGDVRKLDLPGLKADRVPVLPGGFAIMYAAFSELDIEHMDPALGALREGVLYDLLGRFHHHDMRDVTVQPIHAPLSCRCARRQRGWRSWPTSWRASSWTARPDADAAAATGLGRPPARNRHQRRAQRLPQAHRLHPHQCRHAGLLQKGAGSA